MKAVVYACGSAICALGCMGLSLIGVIRLFLDWRWGLTLLAAAAILGVAARFLDRRKMWAIYGREQGDRLHHEDSEAQGPADLARRDAAAYLQQQKAEEVEEAVQGPSR